MINFCRAGSGKDFTMEKKIIIICFGIAIVFFSIVMLRNSSSSSQAASQPAAKIIAVPPGNIAPTQDFLNDYREYQALQKELNALFAEKGIKRKQDELIGMTTRLNRAIPQGYVWDETTMSFKPIPPAIPAPTNQIPQKK